MWKLVVLCCAAFALGHVASSRPEKGKIPKERRVFFVEHVATTQEVTPGDPYWTSENLDDAMARLEKEGWTAIQAVNGGEKDWFAVLCERSD